MYKLSRENEIEIVNFYLENFDDYYIGEGASRVVLSLSEYLKYKLNLPFEKDYVVKIAKGIGGLNQSQIERTTYECHKDSGILAEIVAYGEIINIMESVTPVDSFYRDYDCYAEEKLLEYIYGEGYGEEEKKEFSNIMEVILKLEKFFGCTGDNGQIGKTIDNRYVSYDYGFDADYGDTLTSDIECFCSASDYIQKLGNIIEYCEILSECVVKLENDILMDNKYGDEEEEDYFDDEEEEYFNDEEE